MPDCTFATIYMMLWLLIGSLIFRNIFAGVVVNTFQGLRRTVDDDDNDTEKELDDANFRDLKQFVDVNLAGQHERMSSGKYHS